MEIKEYTLVAYSILLLRPFFLQLMQVRPLVLNLSNPFNQLLPTVELGVDHPLRAIPIFALPQ